MTGKVPGKSAGGHKIQKCMSNNSDAQEIGRPRIWNAHEFKSKKSHASNVWYMKVYGCGFVVFIVFMGAHPRNMVGRGVPVYTGGAQRRQKFNEPEIV